MTDAALPPPPENPLPDLGALEAALRGLLRGRHVHLDLAFNDVGAPNFQTVAEAVAAGDYDTVQWASPEEKAAAIATNSAWVLHWYPDGPGGHYSVGASSLTAVVAAALKVNTSSTWTRGPAGDPS